MDQKPLKIVIVGGVAAGASCAARARRLDEKAEITIIERGPDVSFANCGLPYYIGGEIEDRDALAVQTPQSLVALLNINVLTRTTAIQIDREGKRLEIRGPDEDTRWLDYDKLLLAPGAAPIRPPMPGIDDPRIHCLRNLQDMDAIRTAAKEAKSAVVIGAGFIGLEMVEQLKRLGLEVDLVELQPQVLPQLDTEMSLLLRDELLSNNVHLHLGDGIEGFESSDAKIHCKLKSGKTLAADFVVLSIGVKPETSLALKADIELGPKGHIVVNEYQQTSDADIYAAGDAVETLDREYGERIGVPLGGPANRQGRLVADHMIRPQVARPYPGSLGTAIVRSFGASAGLTGWTERRLKQAGKDYRSIVVNDKQHAGYYPGATPLTLKICWEPNSGRILGAQATGADGVDKRLDVLATAIAGQLTVEDLAQLELSYAPPFGSAKDIVNIAGFTAENWIDGLLDPVDALPLDGATQTLDVRPEPLFRSRPVNGAINIPLPMLRKRLDELDRNRRVVTVCAMGKTSYFAARILAQNGFTVQSFSGGIMGRLDPKIPTKPPAK